MKLKPLDAALLAALLAACQPDSGLSSAPPVDTLAKIVPVAVGARQFYLPVVAVTWAGRSKVLRPCAEQGWRWLCAVPTETLAAYSGINATPVSATSVEVRLEGYSRFKNTKLDQWFDIPQLCGKLTQTWARHQCTGPSLFKDNLRSFFLIEEGSLASENSLTVIGGQKEPARQVVQRMRFVSDEPNIDCASDGQGLCTAAMRIGGGVFAVWIVSSSDAAFVQRQAAAIKAFLTSAVGREENYEALKGTLSRAA